MPENSDSVGRTFESCRAYHRNPHPQPGWGFLLPDTVRSLCPGGANRVGRTIKISTPTGVDIFIIRHDEKFIPRRGKSCRAYQMQEIRTYSSPWEMGSDFSFLIALYSVKTHSAAALCSKNRMDAKCATCTCNCRQIADKIVDSGMLGFGKTLFVEDFSQFINDNDNTAVSIMDISVIHRDKQLVLSAAELTCFRRRSLPRCRFDASRRMRDSASLS